MDRKNLLHRVPHSAICWRGGDSRKLNSPNRSRKRAGFVLDVISALYQGTTFSRADKLSMFSHAERASAREGPGFARVPHPDLGAPSGHLLAGWDSKIGQGEAGRASGRFCFWRNHISEVLILSAAKDLLSCAPPDGLRWVPIRPSFGRVGLVPYITDVSSVRGKKTPRDGVMVPSFRERY